MILQSQRSFWILWQHILLDVLFTSDGGKGIVIRQNKEAADRPVIRMTQHADGTPYTDNVEHNLLKKLTIFIVDTE